MHILKCSKNTLANASVKRGSETRPSIDWWLIQLLFLLSLGVKLAARHQQPKNLPGKRFEVSGKLRLAQLSTLPRRHYSENRNCEENSSLTVGTAWHLHVCSLFGTGDRYELACRMNGSLIAKTRKTLNQGTFLFFQHGKICSMLGSFSLGTRRSRDTAASATKDSSSHKVRGVWKTPTFSAFNIAKETLFIDLTLAKMETVKRIILSQWSLLDTCMCALCWVLVIDVNWIVEKMSHQMASLLRHWTRASACSSKIHKFVQCSAHSCSNWNRQRDSWQRQDSWKP